MGAPMANATMDIYQFRQYIEQRDALTCQYCGEVRPKRYVLEHVIPDALGGPTESYNIVIACRSCNVSKGRNIWAPRNLDSITVDQPAWRQRIIDAVTAAGGHSNRRTEAPMYPPHSYRHSDDLALALVILAKRQRRPAGELLDEAIADLLRKYGEPVPSAPRPAGPPGGGGAR